MVSAFNLELQYTHEWFLSFPALLFLLLHYFDVILRHALQNTGLLANHVQNLVAHVALHNHLIEALRILSDARARRELLREELCGLLEVDAECVQPVDGSDVLALVALDTLDGDLRFLWREMIGIGDVR